MRINILVKYTKLKRYTLFKNVNIRYETYTIEALIYDINIRNNIFK